MLITCLKHKHLEMKNMCVCYFFTLDEVVLRTGKVLAFIPHHFSPNQELVSSLHAHDAKVFRRQIQYLCMVLLGIQIFKANLE